MKVTEVKASDLIPDDANANRHTERGIKMVEASLRKRGFRFAGTLDKNNRIVHGNNRHEQATNIGLDNVVIIEAESDKQYYLRFNDLDLADPDNPARELAYQANRSAQVSIDFEPERILADLNSGLDIAQFFSDNEVSNLLEQLYGSREPTRAINDPNSEWAGMPEFEQEDLSPFRTIHVHFQNEQDIRKFAELVKQSITDSTRYIWYPKVEDVDLRQYKAVDSES